MEVRLVSPLTAAHLGQFTICVTLQGYGGQSKYISLTQNKSVGKYFPVYYLNFTYWILVYAGRCRNYDAFLMKTIL